MTIQDLLNNNPTVLDLVKEYNINSKINKLLYDNPDIAEILKTTHGVNRWDFVDKFQSIENKLIPFIAMYHNRSVVVTKNNKQIQGIILHPETRMFENRTLPNNVTFRTFADGNQGIALWVDTGDTYSSHLYNAEDITIE